MEPAPPALEGEILNIGSPGKSLCLWFFKNKSLYAAELLVGTRESVCNTKWTSLRPPHAEFSHSGFTRITVKTTSMQLWTSQAAQLVRNLPANAGDKRDVRSIPGLRRSPGVRNGNLLQYSCRENPMDRGAWWASGHGAAKSCTWLSTHDLCRYSGRKQGIWCQLPKAPNLGMRQIVNKQKIHNFQIVITTRKKKYQEKVMGRWPTSKLVHRDGLSQKGLPQLRPKH